MEVGRAGDGWQGSANGESKLPPQSRDFHIHDATTTVSGALRIPQHNSIEWIIANMASGRAPSSTPVPTTETAESAGATSTVTAQEWEAMSNLLKNVYDYRIDE